MLYQRNLTVRFGRYFIWKHYQNVSFRILRNDNVFSLFLNRNREVWQVTRSMFRIVFGYFLQINSVIIHLVWLTSLSGIKVNTILIWIRFFQIESGGLIKFIYRPVKHKFINVSFHRCCIILTRGSNCPLSRQRICWKNEQRILTTTACFKTFIAVLPND